MRSYELMVFADEYQFFLQDEQVEGDLADAWTLEAADRLLALEDGIVGIGTVSEKFVPVRVEILESEPLLDLAAFEHVAECSLFISGSRLEVGGCADVTRIALIAGTYRVRANYANLSTCSQGGVNGNDSYLIQLWLAPAIDGCHLKGRSMSLHSAPASRAVH